ncbi:hypothetical protein FEM48_Zijuj06G0166100 [Ziziphus jujuba var. spinosa]|uniref:DNA/RNA-binding domain-containing protein n=1 Tax=Ziziphus jujuba var. spinosa TaxID=714518 RepID=A0A978VAE5_ZIZJJ|nr:hypothetical protein FEM48_Zijuj06G0166100 [Ziziphus jujuba var. spinosa]
MAASLWPSSGNPHHQLTILASYSGDELVAIYRYFRSLAVESPFSTARDNLIVAFEKNHKSFSQLLGDTNVSMIKESSTWLTGKGKVSSGMCELLSFRVKDELNFGANGIERESKGQTYVEILQRTVLLQNASTTAFELMGHILGRCVQLRVPSSSFLLLGILVFVEWYAEGEIENRLALKADFELDQKAIVFHSKGKKFGIGVEHQVSNNVISTYSGMPSTDDMVLENQAVKVANLGVS